MDLHPHAGSAPVDGDEEPGRKRRLWPGRRPRKRARRLPRKGGRAPGLVRAVAGGRVADDVA